MDELPISQDNGNDTVAYSKAALISILFAHLGLMGLVATWRTPHAFEPWLFLAMIPATLFCGTVGIVRIKNSHGKLKGMPLACIGVAAYVIFIAALIYAFMLALYAYIYGDWSGSPP